jgi:hypothetical protein
MFFQKAEDRIQITEPDSSVLHCAILYSVYA